MSLKHRNEHQQQQSSSSPLSHNQQRSQCIQSQSSSSALSSTTNNRGQSLNHQSNRGIPDLSSPLSNSNSLSQSSLSSPRSCENRTPYQLYPPRPQSSPHMAQTSTRSLSQISPQSISPRPHSQLSAYQSPRPRSNLSFGMVQSPIEQNQANFHDQFSMSSPGSSFGQSPHHIQHNNTVEHFKNHSSVSTNEMNSESGLLNQSSLLNQSIRQGNFHQVNSSQGDFDILQSASFGNPLDNDSD